VVNQAHIAKLERRLGPNSSNNTKLPSSDGLKKSARVCSLRPISDKKLGGQEGNRSETLCRNETPNAANHPFPASCAESAKAPQFRRKEVVACVTS